MNDRIEKIKKIVTFFPYDKNLDEMENYCAGYKFSKKIGDNINLYEVGPNYFGGMTDYIRSFVEIGERYIMSYDAHLTSKSNVIFYDKVIKPWLISKNLLVEKSLDDKILEKIKFIFDLEKLKYDVFYKSKIAEEHYRYLFVESCQCIHYEVLFFPKKKSKWEKCRVKTMIHREEKEKTF